MHPVFVALRRRSSLLTSKILGNIQQMPKQKAEYTMNSNVYETLSITSPKEHVLHVQINRPNKRNAMSQQFFKDIYECFKNIDSQEDVRAIIISGAGKMFTSGLDLGDVGPVFASIDRPDVARKALWIKSFVSKLQESFSVLETVHAPVIAAVHDGCIGGGVDLISACDIRLCSADAWFQVKEVDLGIIADLGTLQRLPRAIGSQSLVRELCFTGRKMNAQEAKSCGFVSKVCKDYDSLIEEAINLGSMIATKSPVAVMGTKQQLNYARDHTVQEGLDSVLALNMSALQGEDLMKAFQSSMMKEPPSFSKL